MQMRAYTRTKQALIPAIAMLAACHAGSPTLHDAGVEPRIAQSPDGSRDAAVVAPHPAPARERDAGQQLPPDATAHPAPRPEDTELKHSGNAVEHDEEDAETQDHGIAGLAAANPTFTVSAVNALIDRGAGMLVMEMGPPDTGVMYNATALAKVEPEKALASFRPIKPSQDSTRFPIRYPAVEERFTRWYSAIYQPMRDPDRKLAKHRLVVLVPSNKVLDVVQPWHVFLKSSPPRKHRLRFDVIDGELVAMASGTR
jgi:hypothetical protein